MSRRLAGASAVLASALVLIAARADAQTAPPPDTISPQARAILDAMARAAPPPLPPTKTIADWDARNRAMEGFVARLDAPTIAALQPVVTPFTLGGVPVLKVEPKRGAPRTPALLYVHGGAFTLFSARSTLAAAAQMAAKTGLTVYSVDYTLAPRAHWQTVTDQVIAAYRALLATGIDPKGIGLFGDSAGGNIVAGSVLKLRDAGVPMPGAVLLMSPVTDLTGAGDTRTTLSAADPILKPGERDAGPLAYAPDPGDLRNPYVSPVYGDYAKGFPPTLIQVGTREWLLSDSVREYQAIGTGGGDVVLDVYEGMPHVFQSVLRGTPESDRAYARAAAFWAGHLRP